MPKANLLITYSPAHPGKARDEALALLDEMGEKPEFLESDVEGVFLVSVSDPKKIARNLSGLCREEPEKFSCTFKWIPVDMWVSSDIGDMLKAVKALQDGIKGGEKWKMDVAKRKFEKHSVTEIIEALTEAVDKPNVDLKNPEKIIRVDIIGEHAAISLLSAGEFLDVQKAKGR